MRKTVSGTIIVLTVIFLFVSSAFAQNVTIKGNCRLFSGKDFQGLEDGEHLCSCPEEAIYFHELYRFAAVLPTTWTEIRMNERRPKDLGKITAITFMPRDLEGEQVMPLVYFRMRKTKSAGLEEALREPASYESSDGLTMENNPKQVIVNGMKALKFDFMERKITNIISHVFLNDGFVYTVTFACQFCGEDLKMYHNQFKRILDGIRIGVDVNYCSEKGVGIAH